MLIDLPSVNMALHERDLSCCATGKLGPSTSKGLPMPRYAPLIALLAA